MHRHYPCFYAFLKMQNNHQRILYSSMSMCTDTTMRKTVRNKINGYLCSSTPTPARIMIHSLGQFITALVISCVMWSVIKHNSFLESVQMHRKWERSISFFIAAVWNISCSGVEIFTYTSIGISYLMEHLYR